MFVLLRKTFSGSYSSLTATRRVYFSDPKPATTSLGLRSPTKFT